jgi:putative membrane protein
LMKPLGKIVINIAGFYLASLIFQQITYDYLSALLLAGLVLGIVNVLVRPILSLLTLPINLMTFGLFSFVLSALMVMLTGYLIDGLQIPGFSYALAVSVFISALNMIFMN